MEKASTPRNRLTRSSAKQVNTPKNIEQEEPIEKGASEEVKHNVRKTRRKNEAKSKTNGDTADIENTLNHEDVVEEKLSDKCKPEDISESNKCKPEYISESNTCQDSPKITPRKTPSPSGFRRSLRTRRSSTSVPETDSSSTKMKRSSSFGKLDLSSTPKKRGRRAQSESKDFVFTPKDNHTGPSNSNSEYIPHSLVRKIDKIDEVNEGEKLSEDEKDTDNEKFKTSIIIESECKIKFGNALENSVPSELPEVKASSDTIGKEMDLSTHSETDDSAALIVNDVGCSNTKKNVEIFDISKKNPCSSNLDADNMAQEIQTKTDVEHTRLSQELPLGSIEIENPPSTIITKEDSKCIVDEKDEKETTNLEIENPTSTIINGENSKYIVDEKETTNLEIENPPSTIITGENSKYIVDEKDEKETTNLNSENAILPFEPVQKEPLNITSTAEDSEHKLIGKDDKKSVNDSKSEDVIIQVSKTSGRTEDIQLNNEEEDTESHICNITSLEISAINSNDSDKNNDDFGDKSVVIELDINDAEASKTNDEFVKLDVIDESEVRDQRKEQLQSVVEEYMATPENETIPLNDKSDVMEKCITQCENEIDLVISSDSEDSIVKEQTENSIAVKSHEPDIKQNISKDELNNITSEEIHEISYNDIHNDYNLQCNKIGHVENSMCDVENKSLILNEGEAVSDNLKPGNIEFELINKTEETRGLDLIDTESKPKSSITEMETSNTLDIEFSDPQNPISDNQLGEKYPLVQDNPPPGLGRELKQSEVQGNGCINDVPSLGLDDQVTNQTDSSLDEEVKPQLVNSYDGSNYDEKVDTIYEEDESNKSEDGSCDIYKGLSDSGSYVDENEEGSNFDESHSSEMNSETCDSEYVTSGEEEEEEGCDEEKKKLSNDHCSDSVDIKAKELVLSMNGEKPNDKNPDSPMTYDKALSIINKNRVKKIDDEEFFDMFTEELNRVSEQSGSDSDIAIVDEYLMEPEEASNKIEPKSGNIQNAKQIPRPPASVLPHQPIPMENYPSDLNQSLHAQHGHPMPTQPGHPTMQRSNFTQGTVYQQFDHSMHFRDHLMYNQYGHPSTSFQDPHMLNPSIGHPDINYSGGIYNHPHPMGSVPESAFPTNSTSLKVRTIADMNTTSHKNYSKSDLAPTDERSLEHQHVENPVNTRTNNLDSAKRQAASNKKVVKSRTPILDLLGLDEKALKLLKKVLGLNSIKKELIKRNLEWQKKYLEKNILKSKLRQRGRKNESRYRNLKRFRDTDSSSSGQTSQSSEETSVPTSEMFNARNYGSSSDNDNRKINIEDGSVYVTLKNKNKPKRRNEKFIPFMEKTRNFVSDSSKKVKPKLKRKNYNSTYEPYTKKMTQKQLTVVKSQSGTFTVDPLTTTSQSSDSEAQSLNEKYEIRDHKRKMKFDLASGRNKLSNMFAQHSFKKSNDPKKMVLEPFRETKGPLTKQKLKELKKLPSEILEALANEDIQKKRHRNDLSGSDNNLERPKKIRKKNQKMKIKSKASDQNYIPCVTGGATEFGLNRLDKDGTFTLAEKAAQFRTDQLYGASVKRITSKELMNVKKKQNINDTLAKKRTSRKRNIE